MSQVSYGTTPRRTDRSRVVFSPCVVVFSLALSCLAVHPGQRAHAQDNAATDAQTDPQSLYNEAVEHFKARRWSQAAETFAQAMELDPNPVLAYNTGRSYEYMGELDKAEGFYLKALAMGPDQDTRDVLINNLERLSNVRRQLTARTTQGLGLLEITSTPKGADIRIDGQRIGKTPYQGAWPTGTFTVTVEREDYETFKRAVVLEQGREVVVNASLEYEGRLWTWITLGSGAALIGGGLLAGLEAQSQLDALGDADDQGLRLDEETFESRRSDGEQIALLSNVLYVSGAALVLGSVALYFIEGRPETADAQSQETTQDQNTWRFDVAPTPQGGVHMSLGASF